MNAKILKIQNADEKHNQVNDEPKDRNADIKIEIKKIKENYSDKNLSKYVNIKNYLQDQYNILYNVVSNKMMWKKIHDINYKDFSQNEVMDLLLSLGHQNIKTIIPAILESDIIIKFNPFLDYFETLPAWDGFDHIGKLLNYIKVEDQKFFDKMFRKGLVRTVAGALEKIPFNKHALVLTGPQHDGKSSFIRFLCPASLKLYIKEDLDMDSKDASFALSENFIINLDELANMSKKDVDKTKALMSRDQVKARKPWAPNDSTFPRRASFFGSTNKPEFLTDETGNIRWIIFTIKNILHDNGEANGYSKNIDIDQVWGQAYHLLNNGFKSNLTDIEIKSINKINARYFINSIEIDLIQEMLHPGTKNKHDAVLTTSDILSFINKSTSGEFSRNINDAKLGRALNFLGFERKSIRIPNIKNPRKVYYINYNEKSKYKINEKF